MEYQMEYQTVETRYGLLDVPADDSAFCRSLDEYGEWAYFDVDFLLRFVNVGDVVVESPGFLGNYTLPFSQHVGCTGTVYTFEPSETYPILKQNMLRAKVRNMVAFKATLGAQTYPSRGLENEASSLQEIPLSLDDADRGLTLHLDGLDLADCHLIRLACAGREWCALVGAMDLIGRTRPYISLRCADVQSAWTATSIMLAQGYRAWLYSLPAYYPDNFKQNKRNIFGNLRHCHLIFVPKEKRAGQSIIETALNDFFVVESFPGLASAYERGRCSARACNGGSDRLDGGSNE